MVPATTISTVVYRASARLIGVDTLLIARTPIGDFLFEFETKYFENSSYTHPFQLFSSYYKETTTHFKTINLSDVYLCLIFARDRTTKML